ncbi:MAG: glycosyltransferase family 2 protein [Proteobacteria bacterium]|nr:glycosyltransferase family 2 protein [Pseudomonadota bacterium]MBU1417947.1 glycosyltransferase family 2 protein [Pseudomonadota bacterium]MBU1456649.1 glycosyltransferase family 2 protein [Pseudomonadota bacterium]
MNSPLVAIVILTCNQKQVTLDCLQSFAACQYEKKQIILVDNGSEDGVQAEVNRLFPHVTVLRNEKNLGAAGGRNTGIEYALQQLDFTYIMFMDNDIVVMPDFLSNLVNGLRSCEDASVEIASPLLYQMGTEKIIDCAGGARLNFYTGSTQTRGHGELDIGQYDHERFPNCVPTTVLMHRNALERAGRFDVSFDPYGYEDLDMVLRANLEHSPFLFVPEAVVFHLGSKTGFSGYTAEYTRMKGQNMRRFFKRHASSLQWLCFNLLLPFLSIKTIVRELRRGNVKAILGLAKGFFSGTK